MDEHVIGDLTAHVERVPPSTLAVVLRGRSASRDAPKALAPLFSQVLVAARAEARGVALHFEQLQYFNSSTIAALVHFVREAQAAGVALEVSYDARQRWQRLSFDALRRALRALESPAAGPSLRFVDAPG